MGGTSTEGLSIEESVNVKVKMYLTQGGMCRE